MAPLGHHGFSENRRAARMHETMPHSSKIGAGEITARRNLPNDMLHKKNHRTEEMMGNGEVSIKSM